MQTEFAPDLLANPDFAESERVVRTCVHCGFCTATCPTYVLLGDELDSPRGRIYLMKEMLEKNKPADAKTVKHIDRCLSCLSCMSTCPSGVNYMHLVDHALASHREDVHPSVRRAAAAADAGDGAAVSVGVPRGVARGRSRPGVLPRDAEAAARHHGHGPEARSARVARGQAADLPGRGDEDRARRADAGMRAAGADAADQRGDDPPPQAAWLRGL